MDSQITKIFNNGTSCNEEVASREVTQTEELTQSGIQRELNIINQLAHFYEDCQFQNEYIMNAKVVMQKSKALLCKEKCLK